MSAKPIRNNTEALAALDRLIHCTERGEKAALRATWHPGTYTADRNHKTADNWYAKAKEAESALRAYLAEPKP